MPITAKDVYDAMFLPTGAREAVKPHTVESIHCDDCDEVRPVTYDFMPGGELNDHDATDILCDRHHIVATLHHPRHTSWNDAPIPAPSGIARR